MKTYDFCLKWRKEGKSVISGFHSPMEKECLRILLQGTQPVIISPARGMWQRTPKELKKHIDLGRLLIVSKFPSSVRRMSTRTALERNLFVGGLAEQIFISYAELGGKMEHLCKRWKTEGKQIITFESKYNTNLINMGVTIL